MTIFNQKGNSSKPDFEFDNNTGIMSVKGISMPENTEIVYLPSLEWLGKYKENPCKLTTFNFDLDYINTASSKMLHEILKILESISNSGAMVQINWFYDMHDADIFEIGEEFKDFTKIPFKLIKKKN